MHARPSVPHNHVRWQAPNGRYLKACLRVRVQTIRLLKARLRIKPQHSEAKSKKKSANGNMFTFSLRKVSKTTGWCHEAKRSLVPPATIPKTFHGSPGSCGAVESWIRSASVLHLRTCSVITFRGRASQPA